MKKTNHLIIILFALVIIVMGGFVFVRTSKEALNMNKIHTLKYPLFIENENNSGYYMLPKGATLYFDGTMDEGFSRYRLYLNVYGKPLELSEDSSGAIIPIGAVGIDKTQLQSILKSTKLDMADIRLIIENGNFSESDKLEFKKLIDKK